MFRFLANSMLTMILDGGKLSTSQCSCFMSEGKNWNQFDSQLGDPRASLDVAVKIILCLPGTELQLLNSFSGL